MDENKDIIIVEDIENKEEKKESKRGKFFSYFAVALIASLIGGIISPIASNHIYGKSSSKVSQNSQEVYNTQKVYSTNNESASMISQAAKSAMNSVVGITTVEIQNYGFMEQEVDGVGSGIIVDSNGYILTNSHVVGDGNAKKITVLFENGDKRSAKVLWHDSILDLAIIKVDANNLPVAKLGDSDKLEVGEIAIAIGNPLGLEFQRTVTSGIISGLHRSISVDQNNTIEDLIQTDASINPGNSGGPLLNSKGEVIGINTAKIKSAEGLGFSIPINTAKPIIEEVIKKGTYETVYIGIKGIDVETYERQLGIDLKADSGVIVIEVVSNSPASKGNLRNGDVITKIDNQNIENMNQLKKALYNYKKGDKAKLSIIRNGEKKQIQIQF
ncbi:MAG: Serine protease, S1-C subfamily, contains C-terminal PDZ domain [Sporanaerobacter sp.]|jgi:serine protease Do|uniref:serine protease HtrA n=1 Tax=Sporanaerobacter sp. TaxID=2010183 RepID=UPI003A101768